MAKRSGPDFAGSDNEGNATKRQAVNALNTIDQAGALPAGADGLDEADPASDLEETESTTDTETGSSSDTDQAMSTSFIAAAESIPDRGDPSPNPTNGYFLPSYTRIAPQPDANQMVIAAVHQSSFSQAEQFTNLIEAREQGLTSFNAATMIEPHLEEWWKNPFSLSVHLGFTNTRQGVNELHLLLESGCVTPFYLELRRRQSPLHLGRSIVKGADDTSCAAFVCLQ